MSERNKGGNYRSGDFYGNPSNPPENSRRNNIGSVQPNGQQAFEETQLFNASSQHHPNDQYRRPDVPRDHAPQPHQQQPYPYQQPPQNNYYSNQPPYGQQQYPQYGSPYRRPPINEPDDDDDDDDRGSGKGTMILILITLLIVLAIAVGAIIFLLRKENESSEPSAMEITTSGTTTEPVTETETETETETQEETTESPFVEIPDVSGRYIEVARIKLNEAGIAFKEEYAFSDKVSKDNVISQSVAGGTKVARDTEIKLIVSKGRENADMAEIPDVTGKDYRTAAAELEKLGLIVIVDKSVDAPGVVRDAVVSQTIKPGSKVKKGTTIHLTISSGGIESIFSEPRKGKVVIENTPLNVRERPTSEANQLGTLENGTVIDIIGQSGSWYIISYYGRKGYVASSYVEFIANE